MVSKNVSQLQANSLSSQSADCVSNPIDPKDLDWTLADVSDGNGGWTVLKFSNLLPGEIIQNILGHINVMPNSGPDTLIWGAANDGKFSTKSTYVVVTEGNCPKSNDLWKLLNVDQTDDNFFTDQFDVWLLKNLADSS
ncbi:hypothetical protein SESBI_29950 [Sesbania bispinosa]|nr:hypothetical protein SESBI_29950 [Sesbania bispinosa]